MDDLDDVPTRTIFKPVPQRMLEVPNLLEMLTDEERQELSDGGWEFVEARPDIEPGAASGYTFVFQQVQE